MRVSIVYMGVLKEVAGAAQVERELPAGTTVGKLFATLRNDHAGLDKFANSAAIAVNHEFATADTVLSDGDEVAVLPPVSGGAHAAVVTEKIDAQNIIARVQAPSDGAVIVFEGVVRDNSHGRATRYLDYEAYEPMATRKLTALIVEAKSRFDIRDATIVHRVGRLEIGETSVLIVVASAHRGPAFDACRWIIDTLKKVVPIWKKEYFKDGAVWADGEPFPPEVAAG